MRVGQMVNNAVRALGSQPIGQRSFIHQQPLAHLLFAGYGMIRYVHLDAPEKAQSSGGIALVVALLQIDLLNLVQHVVSARRSPKPAFEERVLVEVGLCGAALVLVQR